VVTVELDDLRFPQETAPDHPKDGLKRRFKAEVVQKEKPSLILTVQPPEDGVIVRRHPDRLFQKHHFSRLQSRLGLPRVIQGARGNQGHFHFRVLQKFLKHHIPFATKLPAVRAKTVAIGITQGDNTVALLLPGKMSTVDRANSTQTTGS